MLNQNHRWDLLVFLQSLKISNLDIQGKRKRKIEVQRLAENTMTKNLSINGLGTPFSMVSLAFSVFPLSLHRLFIPSSNRTSILVFLLAASVSHINSVLGTSLVNYKCNCYRTNFQWDSSEYSGFIIPRKLYVEL